MQSYVNRTYLIVANSEEQSRDKTKPIPQSFRLCEDLTELKLQAFCLTCILHEALMRICKFARKRRSALDEMHNWANIGEEASNDVFGNVARGAEGASQYITIDAFYWPMLLSKWHDSSWSSLFKFKRHSKLPTFRILSKWSVSKWTKNFINLRKTHQKRENFRNAWHLSWWK